MGNLDSSFLNWGLMPAYIGATSDVAASDVFHEMEWGFRATDGVYGVIGWPSLDLVYRSNHNQLVGQTWHEHLEAFASFTSKHVMGSVLEVGAGHGKLGHTVAEIMGSAGMVDWHIIEPNPLASNQYGLLIEGWFPRDLPNELEVRTIVHSHVIEHQPNLQEFVTQQATALEIGGRVIVSWPNMAEMSKNLDLNILMFEHLNFLPHAELVAIFSSKGFQLMDTEYFGGHSIFVCFEKTSELDNDFKSTVSALEFQAICDRYEIHTRSLSQKLNSFFEDSSGTNFLFGAHIFSQFLISAGLDQTRVNFILDNNPEKWGKRLYGTSLNITPPSEVTSKQRVKVGLAMGNYEREVVDQLTKLLPQGSQIHGSRVGWAEIA